MKDREKVENLRSKENHYVSRGIDSLCDKKDDEAMTYF